MGYGQPVYSGTAIEDLSFFTAMVYRIIEDLEVAIYMIARQTDADSINGDVAWNAINLIESGPRSQASAPGSRSVQVTRIEVENALLTGYTYPDMVRGAFRSRLSYAESAVELVAKYVNLQVDRAVADARLRAQNDSSPKVKLRHILPYCEEWPYPLNRFC
jgi:hypothetical protein